MNDTLSVVLRAGGTDVQLEALGREAEVRVERPAQVHAVLGLVVAEEAGAGQRETGILEEVDRHDQASGSTIGSGVAGTAKLQCADSSLVVALPAQVRQIPRRP